MLNGFTPLTVWSGEDTATFGGNKFPNLLFSQLNQVVRTVKFVPAEALHIEFDTRSWLSMSLRSEEYVGPEAITLFLLNGAIVVE